MHVQAHSVYSQHSRDFGGRCLPGVVITGGPPGNFVTVGIRHAGGRPILKRSVQLDRDGAAETTLNHVGSSRHWRTADIKTIFVINGEQPIRFRLNDNPHPQESFHFTLVNEKTHQRYMQRVRTDKDLPPSVEQLLHNPHAFVPRLQEIVRDTDGTRGPSANGRPEAITSAAPASIPDITESTSPEDDGDDGAEDDGNGGGEVPTKRAKRMEQDISLPVPRVERQAARAAEEEEDVDDEQQQQQQQQQEEPEEEPNVLDRLLLLNDTTEDTQEGFEGNVSPRPWNDPSLPHHSEPPPLHSSQESNFSGIDSLPQTPSDDAMINSGLQPLFPTPSPPSPPTSSLRMNSPSLFTDSPSPLHGQHPPPPTTATAASTVAAAAFTVNDEAQQQQPHQQEQPQQQEQGQVEQQPSPDPLLPSPSPDPLDTGVLLSTMIPDIDLGSPEWWDSHSLFHDNGF